MNMKLRIKLLDPSLREFYQNMANYSHDSGFDLYCPNDLVIPPSNITCLTRKYSFGIPLGIACQPVSDTPHGYYLYPRSSISKTPLRLANQTGIIDFGYRGEIIAKVDNISSTDFLVSRGTRLFQLCAPDLTPIDIEILEDSDELESSERGSGGFGSTSQ
jgi:dUTP pyrophosphatase